MVDMEHRYWLLILFATLFPVSAQGHEACYNDSWTYHQHTHSCLRLYTISKKWTEARDYCAGIQLGSNYGVVTHLAKIDDSQTNSFVRTLFPNPGWACWIGLHKTDGQFRWDGYPDETPKFLSSNWEDSSKPYVSIVRSDDLWMGRNGSVTRHFECQHGAKKIGPITCEQAPEANGLRFTCSSARSPIKAKCQWTYKYNERKSFGSWRQVNPLGIESHTAGTGSDISYTTTCSFTLSNLTPGKIDVNIRMYPNIHGINLSGNSKARTLKGITINVVEPEGATFIVSNKNVNGPVVIVDQGSDDVTITCNLDTGSPAVSSTTMSCDTLATIGGGVTSVSYSVVIRQVKGDMDKKKCTCWGNHLTGRTEDSVLTLRVITKPNKVMCQSDLHPDKLLVSCQPDKIFPKALCTFSHRNEKETIFNPVSSTNIIKNSDESYRDGSGLLYYKSNCSIILTRDDIDFSPGALTVQVTVNPNIEGIDRDTSSDAFKTTQKIVNIVAPSKPQFQRLGKPLDSSNPLHLVENDRMDLQCQVLSGTPSVSSVTMSCEFPFKDSDKDNKHTVAGTAYVINERASRDMNGRSCKCIGNHLTGPIESSPLTFNVKYPAEVKHFTLNGKEPEVVADVNETLTLSCQADGNPMPFVRIRKLGTNYLDTSTWQSNKSESRVAITLAAQCDHNGRYRCSVGNMLNNDEESQELDVRVKCPPSYCNESSRDIKMAVRPGRSQTVSLCVVAYPMPNFTLWKNSTTGWTKLDSLDDQFTQVRTFDSQQNVTIKFPVLQPSNLGQYALTDSVKKDVTSADLHFHLTEYRSKGDDDDDVGVIVAAVVSVVVVIIIVVVVVIFFLWRRKKKEAKRESPYENTGTASSENKTYYGRDNYTQVDVPTKEKGTENKENKTQGGDNYTQVDVSKKKKGVTVYDNDGFMKESDNTKDNGPEKEEDTEGAYQQTADQDTKPENKTSESRKASGEDDMVYIELDFKYKTDDKAKPQKKSKPKSKPKEVKRDDNQDEPSVYSSISANATIKIKLEKEKKEEEEKNQNKGAAAGGEEAVYENVKRESDVP